MQGLNLFRLCLFLLLSAVVSCTPDTQQSQLQKIQQNNTLRVGTLYGLTNYYIERDIAAGYEYELLSGFADYLDVELNVYPYYNLNSLFLPLHNGRLDIVAAGLTQTDGRQPRFRFSPQYHQVTAKLVFKQGKFWPRNIDQLAGTLVVTANSSHAEYLQQLQQQHPKLNWVETDEFDAEELVEQVINEQIDYTIIDDNLLALIRRRYPEVAIAFTVGEPQPLSWLLQSSNDTSLQAALIDYFAQLRRTGELARLEEKYFSHARSFDYVDTRSFIKSVKSKLPQYRAAFEQYADQIDWRLVAALSYQESHWNPKAKSVTGVRGIMMLTQPTAKDYGVTNRLEPLSNIRGGSAYLNNLLKRVPARIPQPDRTWFALAGYNLGMGHLEDARVLTQKHGGDPDSWLEVKERLPLLGKKKYYRQTKYGFARGNQAVEYVTNIRRYYDTLVWLDEKNLIIPVEHLSN